MLKENNECSLFEFDEEKISVRMPDKKDVILPRVAVMCFFKEVVDEYSKLKNVEKVMEIHHDIIAWKFYKTRLNDIEIVFCQAPMGAPICVNVMEDLFSNGVEIIIACGGCGVLDDITKGKILLPTVAIRDEGTSFHYMRPSKEIYLDQECINQVKEIMQNLDVEFLECKTWTTDASKRETPEKIKLRKNQGCKTVEMECSALAACAKFRNKKFVELLYSGDLVFDTYKYNDRHWQFDRTSREKLFNISLEIASKLKLE